MIAWLRADAEDVVRHGDVVLSHVGIRQHAGSAANGQCVQLPLQTVQLGTHGVSPSPGEMVVGQFG